MIVKSKIQITGFSVDPGASNIMGENISMRAVGNKRRPYTTVAMINQTFNAKGTTSSFIYEISKCSMELVFKRT